MGLNKLFWKGRRVFITGHTGFKGSWLSFWLAELGADVKGFSLVPDVSPNLYDTLSLGNRIESVFGDIRNLDHLKRELAEFKPEVVFHMAAQAIVRTSYDDPIETFETNVIGTVNLLESVKFVKSIKAVISVTSDKCYENREWDWKYRESDPMGGWDPYSASKGCAELVTASFRRSYFQNGNSDSIKTGIATARAGNVIGGGDWSKDRLIPDIMRSFSKQEPVVIRNPAAVRPWQYILDLLHGYMVLAEKLYKDPKRYSEAWNFGPSESDERSVEFILNKMIETWGEGASWKLDKGVNPHEASYLKLDSSKSRMNLGWNTKVTLPSALESLTSWYKNYFYGADITEFTKSQIREFEKHI